MNKNIITTTVASLVLGFASYGYAVENPDVDVPHVEQKTASASAPHHERHANAAAHNGQVKAHGHAKSATPTKKRASPSTEPEVDYLDANHSYDKNTLTEDM